MQAAPSPLHRAMESALLPSSLSLNSWIPKASKPRGQGDFQFPPTSASSGVQMYCGFLPLGCASFLLCLVLPTSAPTQTVGSGAGGSRGC